MIKKSMLVFGLLFTGLLMLSAQAVRPFGIIDYVEGSVTITRQGKQLGEANFGDEVLPNDLVQTSGDGLAIIALDSSTGMRGTLTIKARTNMYLRLQTEDSSPKSSLELLAGQMSAKVSRLSGTPSMEVLTDSAVMGVRGTEFGFASSPTGSVMVYCTESSVTVTDSAGGQPLIVSAGKAAEKKAGERLRLLPVTISNAADFESRWFADDIEAFKANAVAALGNYARRYNQLFDEFNRIFEPFQKDDILTKWLREDAQGTTPPQNSAGVLREKRAMIAHLMPLRRNLFIFERIYYRLDQLADIILGTSLERSRINPQQTAGEFLRKVRNDATVLGRRVALVRYAEVLYALRNGGAMPTDFGSDGFFGGEDDFFGSSDDL